MEESKLESVKEEKEPKVWKRSTKEHLAGKYFIKLPEDKKVDVNLGFRKKKIAISERGRFVSAAIKAKKRELNRRLTPEELETVTNEAETQFVKFNLKKKEK